MDDVRGGGVAGSAGGHGREQELSIDATEEEVPGSALGSPNVTALVALNEQISTKFKIK